LSDSYFHFTIAKISPVPPFYILLNFFRKQKNRIGLLKNGDLTLDSLQGGALLLIIMPTFSGGDTKYNLVYKRRSGG